MSQDEKNEFNEITPACLGFFRLFRTPSMAQGAYGQTSGHRRGIGESFGSAAVLAAWSKAGQVSAQRAAGCYNHLFRRDGRSEVYQPRPCGTPRAAPLANPNPRRR